MTTSRARAIWLAAALVLLAFATAGSALATHDAAEGSTARSTAHHAAVDHDAALSARPLADRSPLDQRLDTTTIFFLLAWLGAVVAALLARTVSRSIAVGARRVPPPVPERRRFDRGPPAHLAFA